MSSCLDAVVAAAQSRAAGCVETTLTCASVPSDLSVTLATMYKTSPGDQRQSTSAAHHLP